MRLLDPFRVKEESSHIRDIYDFHKLYSFKKRKSIFI